MGADNHIFRNVKQPSLNSSPKATEGTTATHFWMFFHGESDKVHLFILLLWSQPKTLIKQNFRSITDCTTEGLNQKKQNSSIFQFSIVFITLKEESSIRHSRYIIHQFEIGFARKTISTKKW